jgi:hypothetical protein
MSPLRWVLLSSRLPREPSRLRLGVWRRLRRLGAVLLHDAVWVLPAGPSTREAFEWIAEEIAEEGGTAFLWEASSLDEPQNRELVRRFRTEADARYAGLAQSARDILRTARRPRSRAAQGAAQGERRTALRQLQGLERALRLERRRDYFRAAGRVNAAAAVAAALATLDLPRSVTRAAGADHALDHPTSSAR